MFLIINSSVPEMAVDIIMESRDAIFFEDEFSMKNNTLSISNYDSISIPESHEPIVHADVESHEEVPEEDNNIVTRKSKRQRVAKIFSEDFIIYLMDYTPSTIVEVYSSLDADLWKEAVQSEMDSIMSNGTWKWLIVLMDVTCGV
jgi:hypothetical protein